MYQKGIGDYVIAVDSLMSRWKFGREYKFHMGQWVIGYGRQGLVLKRFGQNELTVIFAKFFW